MKAHIANIITASRVLGSISLIFFPTFSLGFYIIYIICGFTDMIDGTIARNTNSVSNLGAKIDTVADLVFVTVSMIKTLPKLHIPSYFWIWIIVIGIIKICSILWGIIYKRMFISHHTALNKITGLLMFLLPLTRSFIEQKYSIFAVCAIATFAAIQEGVYILRGCESK